MPTKVKGPDKPKQGICVEYPDGTSVDGKCDRTETPPGTDPMTGKPYFYRGGVKKPQPVTPYKG